MTALGPAVARLRGADFFRWPEQFAGAFDGDQGQQRKTSQVAEFHPTGNDERIDRIVQEKSGTGGGGKNGEQGRPAAVEQHHHADRQKIEKDRMRRTESGELEIPKHRRHCGHDRKRYGDGDRPLQKDRHAHSPRPFGPLLVGTIADVPAMEQAEAGNYSTTILTSLPGRNFSPGSRPLSTRNRSTARSVTAMRPASFSTVSPGATVATTRCSGLACSISARLMRRNVPIDSRNARSVSGVRCLVAKMKR